MSTDYYLRTNVCNCCGRYDKQYIGRQSAGWKFCFQSYPDIESFQDLIHKVNENGGQIVNEFGQSFTISHFREMVDFRQKDRKLNRTMDYLDGEGYWFTRG